MAEYCRDLACDIAQAKLTLVLDARYYSKAQYDCMSIESLPHARRARSNREVRGRVFRFETPRFRV